TFAVHADACLSTLEHFGEIPACELAALVGVEDFWFAVAIQGFLDSLNAEVDAQGVGDSPGKNPARVPVHDCSEVHKTFRHRNVGNIHCPNLIGPGDSQSTK